MEWDPLLALFLLAEKSHPHPSSNGDTGMNNRVVDTVREQERGRN